MANCLGVDLADTDISFTTAWEKAQSERLSIAKMVKEEFICPEKVALHWDVKTLKVKGNVYMSGTVDAKARTLLAVPETQSGTGKAEAEVEQQELMEWKIKEQMVSQVFDTTASNSSGAVCACRYLEDSVGFPLLWTACRHHIYMNYMSRR